MTVRDLRIAGVAAPRKGKAAPVAISCALSNSRVADCQLECRALPWLCARRIPAARFAWAILGCATSWLGAGRGAEDEVVSSHDFSWRRERFRVGSSKFCLKEWVTSIDTLGISR